MVKSKNVEINKALGKHLSKLRADRKLSQEELANLIDIPISQVGRIERGEGNPTVTTLHLFAQAFNISIKDLFSFNDA
ncbi:MULTISPECIES: helix-turn-helix domain-containing protein [Sphingobacterium]|uniref:Helix-turn-helix domain-containing protein n=1 Tax=Sphingobacterium populi TaxID=1812824 RepID=A0ABW5UCD0_9SPHI|nr:helix-turn-helix transcriptional regulator [Sphingobacterium sp. CFCC 11742]